MTYNFPVPNLDPYFREKPGAYVANLLGHEGAGSLHAQLKARGWIESLGASAARFDADNALVMVSIELTEDGSTHVDEITRALFDYIALIRTQGIAKWRYEEQAKVAQLAFRFQESSSPMSFVYNTAPNLRLYPVKDVLEGPYLMERYDEALIRRYIDALRPDNLLLEVSGQKVDADKIEPWFQVPYGDRTLTTNLSGAAAEFGLALPPPNEFLPTNLKLETQPESAPKRVDSTPSLALWWAPDTSFGTPRATTYVRLDVAGGFRFAGRRGLREPLWPPRARRAQHVRVSGPGGRAQLRHRRQSTGFLITVSGYDDKQPLLLSRILDVFANIAPSQQKVADYREELRRSWQNFVADRPYEQAMASLSHVMVAGGWPPAQLSNAFADVTPERLAAWRRDRLNHYGALLLMHGNVDFRGSGARGADRQDRRSISIAWTRGRTPSRGFPAGDFTYPLTIDNADSAMVMYLQGANDRSRSARCSAYESGCCAARTTTICAPINSSATRSS